MPAEIPELKKQDWFHEDGFPIQVELRDPQTPFYEHTHEFSEIVIITGGSGRHVAGDCSWLLSAGDVFIIGGKQPHDYQDLNNLRLVNILFEPKPLKMSRWGLSEMAGFKALFNLEPVLGRRDQFRSRLCLNPRDLAHVEALTDNLSEELLRRDEGFRCLAKSLFMQIVGFLSRCYRDQQHPNSQGLLRLAATISYMEQNLQKEFCLDELAAMAQMSRRSFVRAFNAATGNSPISHVIQLRVRKAAELLRRGDASVTQVAFDVGFNDSNYFSRQFRSIFGMPPRRFRDQHMAD